MSKVGLGKERVQYILSPETHVNEWKAVPSLICELLCCSTANRSAAATNAETGSTRCYTNLVWPAG